GRGGRSGAPVEVEAVRPDTTFRLSLKVDQALFSRWAQRAELPSQGAEWLTQLPRLVQAQSHARIRRELDWYGQIGADTAIVQFYQQLANARLGSRRCLIQLGWGTGWESKTFGVHLQADALFMDRIVRDY